MLKLKDTRKKTFTTLPKKTKQKVSDNISQSSSNPSDIDSIKLFTGEQVETFLRQLKQDTGLRHNLLPRRRAAILSKKKKRKRNKNMNMSKDPREEVRKNLRILEEYSQRM